MLVFFSTYYTSYAAHASSSNLADAVKETGKQSTFHESDSSSSTLPEAVKQIGRQCSAIRTSDGDVSAQEKQLLISLSRITETQLASLGKEAQAIYRNAAYGFFLNYPGAPADNPELKKMHDLAIPVVLSKEMLFITLPEGGMFVVLEKITDSNIKAWRQYVQNEINYDSPELYSIGAVKEDKLEDNIKFIKYIKGGAGLSYFKGRINHWKQELTYDMWIAYVTRTSPYDLQKKHLTGEITPDDLDMAMTLQAKDGLETYSPMGISRTIAWAKRMYADEKAGKLAQQQITTPLSVCFHALTCRLVQTIYPAVRTFWTTPTKEMRIILASALNPHLGIKVKDKLTAEQIQKVKKVTCGSNSIPETPWGDHYHFGSLASALGGYGPLGTTIAAKDLLRVIFPY